MEFFKVTYLWEDRDYNYCHIAVTVAKKNSEEYLLCEDVEREIKKNNPEAYAVTVVWHEAISYMEYRKLKIQLRESI